MFLKLFFVNYRISVKMIKSTKHKVAENKMTLKFEMHKIIDNDDKIKLYPLLNDHYCEFYLQEKNVTPQELTNIKYIKLEIEQWINTLLEKEPQILQVDENYKDLFLHMNVKTIKNLLNDVFDNTDNLNNYNYDIGLNIPYSRENIVTQGYEIELTESKTYSILDLPSSVTIKG